MLAFSAIPGGVIKVPSKLIIIGFRVWPDEASCDLQSLISQWLSEKLQPGCGEMNGSVVSFENGTCC